MKLSHLLAVTSLNLAPVGASAAIIDTTSLWNGTTSVNPYGGTHGNTNPFAGGSAVYGETFIAPADRLTSFTFHANDHQISANIIGQVYAWSGALLSDGISGAVGSALFTSKPLVTDGSGTFQAITIVTGQTVLTKGQSYVVLFADTTSDNSSADFGAVIGSSVLNDGKFVVQDNNHTLAQISSQPWTCCHDFGSLAYTATFVNSTVPEPSAWTLMVLGYGVLGIIIRRNSRVMPIVSA